MSRLTRAESRERTREQLLTTAERLFLAEGYGATSLERIATEAGYSKGAVYSNFTGKPEVGLAVLDRMWARRMAALGQAVHEAPGLDELIEAFGRWAADNIGDEAWTALEVEFATAVRHQPAIREAIGDRRRAITAGIAALLAELERQHGLRLPMPAEQAALVLLGLGIGLGVQRALDPRVPVTPLVDLLRRFAG